MCTMNTAQAEIVRQAMRIIRGVNSPSQQAASRENGKKGGRPAGSLKPLSAIPCNCEAEEIGSHKSTCPRGRAVRRRQGAGQPLE